MTTKNALAIIAFLMTAFLVLVVWLANVRTPSTSPTISGAQAPIVYREAPGSRKVLPAERLAAAKRLLRQGTPHMADILLVLQQLRAIPATAPEHSEAQHLLKEAMRRFKRIQRAADILKNPIVVVRSNWNKGGFGSVALWTVTFRNRSLRRVGDIRYETKYWTETDRLIGSGSGTIGKIVQPGRMRKLEINDGFIQSDAARASFTIVGWRYLETEAEAVARSKRQRIARAARAAKAKAEAKAEAARVAKLRAKLIADQQARIDRRLAIEQGGKRWHSLRTGMSKEEVISILGKPSKVVPVGTRENWFFPGSVTAYCIFEDDKLKSWWEPK